MTTDRPGAGRRYRQQVPRPADAEIVEEAEARFAWLSSADAAILARWPVVERAFDGSPAQGSDVVLPSSTGQPSAAAVLLPLLAREPDGRGDRGDPSDRGGRGDRGDRGEVSLVLIRRGMNLRSNPGEIAFPGGRVEPGESPLGAALREAFEEVALDPSAVRLLGELPAVSRVSRPEPIAAFVVAVAGEPLLTPNPDEVDDILITPLAELVDPSVYWEELWRRPDGIVWRMSFFDLGDDLLWGASARILVSLFERLAAITTI